jgi:hypothetical protein
MTPSLRPEILVIKSFPACMRGYSSNALLMLTQQQPARLIDDLVDFLLFFSSRSLRKQAMKRVELLFDEFAQASSSRQVFAAAAEDSGDFVVFYLLHDSSGPQPCF